MTPDEMKIKLHEIIPEIVKFQKDEALRIVGVLAVNHYTESFVNEGFEDKEIKKWPDVKRRNPESEWYGFSYRSNSAKPVKTDGDGKKVKNKSKANFTNFSPEATTNKILHSTTEPHLDLSIHCEIKSDRVSVFSDSPYAAVHQFGMPAKVFGKAEFTMKPRPFIGKSEVLNNAIKAKIEKELKKIIEK